MKLGAVVTLITGAHAGRPHVVVHEPVKGRVQLCYFGSARWYVPEWHPVAAVSADLRDMRDHTRLRRCRRVLADLRPDPDGWKRISVGRSPHLARLAVGHIELDRQPQPPEVDR
jgi:hypothetical protein